MKLTVDSNEPIEDALRVVGALYGVTVVVSEAGPTTSKPKPRKASLSKKNSDGTGRRARTAVADKSSGRARKPKVAQPTNAEVRAWARKTGVSVSERGRVPASVMTAYRDAHM